MEYESKSESKCPAIVFSALVQLSKQEYRFLKKYSVFNKPEKHSYAQLYSPNAHQKQTKLDGTPLEFQKHESTLSTFAYYWLTETRRDHVESFIRWVTQIHSSIDCRL